MRWNPLTLAARSTTPAAAVTPSPHKINVTVADGVKTAFTVFVGGFCPFAILVILTISAGFYFNALRGFSLDVQSVVAYGTALIVELVNLALFFVSAKSFWAGKTWHFLAALVVGIGLTLISIVAQVLYLSNNLDATSLKTGADILQGVPLIGGLASPSLIIITRALALHVAEFACCYVVARSAVSHRKIIQAQQEEEEAALALMEAQQFTEFKRAIHQAQMSQLKRMQAVLESHGSVQISAVRDQAPLPPATPASQPRQPIAGESSPLVPLDVDHADQESEVQSNGARAASQDPFRRARNRPPQE